MGLWNDLFGTPKPRVTEKEYKKAKSELFSEGFSKKERAKVDQVFGPDFNMPGTDSHPRGLEKNEVEARLKWMRENKNKHDLSDQEINKVEEVLKKRL